MGIQVSPIFRFRSALPVALTGLVLFVEWGEHRPAVNAYVEAGSTPTITRRQDDRTCTTINCGRRALFNLQASVVR